MPPIMARNSSLGAKNYRYAEKGGDPRPESCGEGTPVLRDCAGLLDCFSSDCFRVIYATPRSRAAAPREANRLRAPHLHGAGAGGFIGASSARTRTTRGRIRLRL